MAHGQESKESPYRLFWLARRRGRAHRVPLLCLAIVLVDQATKAIQPTGTFVVNPGGAAILPSRVNDALWRNPTFGAPCDTSAAAVLLTALVVANRQANPNLRVAATGVIAGLLSNLIDRMGGSSLFHHGLPRSCIDWIPVPAWSAARTNLGDRAIVVGVLALAYQPARQALHARHRRERSSRHARTMAAGTGLMTIALWTTFWEANRNAAGPETTARSETATRCASTAYTSDGIDWLSYRPKAGPVPYHAVTPLQTASDCS
jgi:hypothetical protein